MHGDTGTGMKECLTLFRSSDFQPCWAVTVIYRVFQPSAKNVTNTIGLCMPCHFQTDVVPEWGYLCSQHATPSPRMQASAQSPANPMAAKNKESKELSSSP
jgi:hypothetical protein